MAGQSVLSRCTRLIASFDHIDAAIEAADPSISRDEFRRLRVQIVEMLCAAEDDDHKADGLCVILDRVMVESLVTLQSLPADVVPRILASSADLANAVGALRSHGSERVRRLARDIIREWKTSIEGDIIRMTAAMAKLDALSQLPPSDSTASHVFDGRNDNAPSNPKTKMDQPRNREDKPYPKKAADHVVGDARVAAGPRKTVPAAGISHATMADKQVPVKKSESMPETAVPSRKNVFREDLIVQSHQRPERQPALEASCKIQDNPSLAKKMAPVVVGPGRAKVSDASHLPKKTTPVAVRHGVRTERNTVASPNKVRSPEERKEVIKRKLREGYQEATDAKRQRKIQNIEAPKTLEQRQGKVQPIMRERSRARCGSSTAVRR